MHDSATTQEQEFLNRFGEHPELAPPRGQADWPPPHMAQRRRTETQIAQPGPQAPAQAVASPIDEVEVERIVPPTPEDEDYFPMFFSSLQAGLLSVLVQILSSIYFALQYGASIELRMWFKVIPLIAMGVASETFSLIVMWSAIVTAVCLAAFSTMAFVRRRRLQVQAGRLFAWLNMALIGGINLVRVYFFEDFARPEAWMFALVLIGLVAFAVGSYLIWVDFDDRRQAETPLQ